jgi:2-polyprenyl-3-methyl-5-hydroxy-6-metoxy-1,4-benzoquinol methylase
MKHQCRFCGSALQLSFCDLGTSPLSNAFLKPSDCDGPETFYPLHARVCENCFLVQLPLLAAPESIFTEYAYFSSYSSTWLEHCSRYAAGAARRFQLGPDSLVVEVASNDGYLLQYFRERGIPVLGIEPARNVGQVARAKGIETLARFFGTELAKELAAQGRRADLLVANNVLAHVPDINDFVKGIALAIKPAGIATIEFPHLLQLIQQCQFDTIYHEHFSYISLTTVTEIFRAHGLKIFDAEELPTHGGSLRIYAADDSAAAPAPSERLQHLLEKEARAGMRRPDTYVAFSGKVQAAKRSFLSFLLEAKQAGKSVVAYGAAAKGNTLLNYCGVRADLIDYVVDRNPYKQGRYLPGSRIPICPPARVFETKPDYLLLLAWNLAPEIIDQMAGIRSWGAKFVKPLPEVEFLA